MTRPDKQAIIDALKPDVVDLAVAAFGPLLPASGENRSVKANPSLSVAVRGSRQGQWQDFAAPDNRGDILDLFALAYCGLDRAAADFARVLDTAAKHCGLMDGDALIDQSAAERRRKAQAAKDKAEEAQEAAKKADAVERVAQAAQPIEDSPAAAYLRRRGVDTLPAKGLAYAPPLPAYSKGIMAPEKPALIVWGYDAQGRVRGGQRILIEPDGRPANIEKRKPAFGAVKGVRAVFPAQVDGEPLYIAEGPESALTVHMVTGAEVWAVFGVGNWQHMPLPAGRKVVLCPDMDPDGSPAQIAFREAKDGFAARGFDVWIATPPAPYDAKDDFNDTLRRDGIEAVREALRAAQKVAPPAPKIDTLPPAADLSSRRSGDLITAMQAAPIEDAAAVAHAVAIALQWRAPFEYDAAHVVEPIKAHMFDKLSSEVFDLLRNKVDLVLKCRKNAVLDRTAIPKQIRHEVRTVTSLSEIDVARLSGVVLIKAPMGAGKTQKIGKPLADLHRAGFMAVSHRVSLIDELAARLKVDHYRSSDKIDHANGVAVCLPSIARADLRSSAPRVMFIDEVAQVLRFLESNAACSCGDAMNSDIYECLLEMVRTAETVVAADADLDPRTIRFIEQARPDERFTIYQMPPKPNGKSAVFYADTKPVLDLVSVELETGGKAWVACEARKKAEAYARTFRDRGYSVLCVTSSNKDGKAQKEFLKNAERESRKYDLVIASPAISSGLSIEHKDSPHFTLGAFLGAGTAIRPEDATQMIARVRYLKTVLIGTDRTNLQGAQSAEGIKAGLMGAARIEDAAAVWTDFDSYAAAIKAEDANARADFAAGLWWQLEAAGWTVERGHDGDEGNGRQIHKDALQAYTEGRTEALLSAAPMTRHEYDMALRLREIDPQVRDRIEATQIRLAFGRDVLTEEDVKAWDGGRFTETRKRFEDFIGADVARSHGGQHITQRNLRTARRKLYARLFAGVDISEGFILTAECAETIVDRIMKAPEAFAAVGIVGSRYQQDNVKRPKSAVKLVKDILKKCGLTLREKRTKKCPDEASLVYKRGACGQQAEKGQRQKRYYVMTAGSYQGMVDLVARRAAYTLPQEIPTPPAETMPQETIAAAPTGKGGTIRHPIEDAVQPETTNTPAEARTEPQEAAIEPQTPEDSQSASERPESVVDAAQLEFGRAERVARALAGRQQVHIAKMQAKPQAPAAQVAHALQIGITAPANIARQTGLEGWQVVKTLKVFEELHLAREVSQGEWNLTFAARIMPNYRGPMHCTSAPFDPITGNAIPKPEFAPQRHLVWMAKEQPIRLSKPRRRYAVTPNGDVELVRDFTAEERAAEQAAQVAEVFQMFEAMDAHSPDAWQ